MSASRIWLALFSTKTNEVRSQSQIMRFVQGAEKNLGASIAPSNARWFRFPNLDSRGSNAEQTCRSPVLPCQAHVGALMRAQLLLHLPNAELLGSSGRLVLIFALLPPHRGLGLLTPLNSLRSLRRLPPICGPPPLLYRCRSRSWSPCCEWYWCGAGR